MKGYKSFCRLMLPVLLLAGCAPSGDPVDRLVTYLESCLDILEENKTDPPAAGKELLLYRLKREQEVSDLLLAVKNYNPEETAQAAEKLAPVADRLYSLLHERPALFLNEYVARAFEEFDLGF